jgi:phage repressor protein C with HTH and peptisase S24 domain
VSFAGRLRLLIDEKSRGNSAEFARLCGVKEASIRQYLGGTKPSLDNLIAISAATDTSMDWIGAGRGRKNYIADGNISSTGAVPVLRIHLAASAGHGAFEVETPDLDTVALPVSLLDELGIKATDARVLESSGISMLPTIGDGDWLIATVAKDRRSPVDGMIYVFSIDDALFVKRLRRSASGWIMVSDNQTLYPPEPISPASTVTIHGQIVWVGRRLS